MFKISVLWFLPFLFLTAAFSVAGEKAASRPSPMPMEGEDFSSWRNKPHEEFSKGSEVFNLVKQELLKNYYDKGLREEDLYRAAVQGMVQNIDPTMRDWNVLMTPTEFKELSADIEGKIVGVGMEVAFNELSGYAEVRGVIPGTPAAKAGLSAGDQILRINDKSYKGKQLRDVVYAIRGKVNTEVKLTLLHDEAIKTIRFKREALVWDTVKSRLLPDQVGLVTIRNFTEATPKSLKDAIAKLSSQGMKSMIVDLRFNEGGIFEAATESIRVFVPKGKPIVRMQKRDQPEETIVGTSDPLFKGPLVVLMNEHTKSGAEIMAAALKMSGGATTVGNHTFGKWSAQRVDELPNGYAIKYTIATFKPPQGEDLSGKGLVPDINVDFDAEAAQKLQSLSDTNAMLRGDLQLGSALNVLKLKK